MSNEEFQFQFFTNKNNNQHHHKVWLAAMNPQEFQRLMRLENCELISIPTICDEIAVKLTEDANQLVAAESSSDREAAEPMRSFLVASRYFIGLIYVHKQQVQFLYDLASHYTIPTRFLIEDQNIVAKTESEEEMSPSPKRATSKKALKRKSSMKGKRTSKRNISLVLDTSDEKEDIEAQNLKTMDLLQGSFVSKNADISIHEPDPVPVSNESINCFGMQFNEDYSVPERNDFGNASLEDVMMSMTLNESQDVIDEVAVPTNVLESTRQSGTVYEGTKNAEKISNVLEEGAGLELGLENGSHSMDDSIEMSILIPPNSTRKRKRTRRNPPLKDITLSVNVEENVKTVSTTQRHLHPKDDSVTKLACLSNLSRKIFVEPSHTSFSESMSRQFESKSMSDKLVKSFKRMALTKTEETNRDMVQEFWSNLQDDNRPVNSMPPIDNPVEVVPRQRTELSLPCVELSVDGQANNDQSMSIEEQISAPPPTVEPPIYEDLAPLTAEPSIYEHMPVELHPSIRHILITNETVDSFTRCDTDSQKLFASKSRQNRLDWGKEGVLQKLMSLWNSGVYPIGMKEIMQSNNQRMSAATAFFSVMELSSTRIGLITLTKCPDSNVIFNITKSPKLIELHESV